MSEENRKSVERILIIATILIAVLVGSHSFLHRNDRPKTISVKGSAEQEILSDLIVWNITIVSNMPTPLEGLREVDRQREVVMQFLSAQGIPTNTVEPGAVSYRERTKGYYDNNQNRYVEIHQGYDVEQTLIISSNEVDLVEKVSRNVGDLIEQNVTAISEAPQYYYTKLADLKLELLAQAADDARNRALQIAKESKGSLGGLRKSNMGVFQILGKHSDDSYSWGGTFNTSSKEKRITITVTSEFLVK